MRFVRQRVLESIDPLVGAVVTIALAIAGLGYWSLVLGPVAGSICGGIAAVATSPYPLRLRYDRGTLREYFSFSWPLLAASASGLVIVQGAVLIGNFTVGLAGLGALGLATTFSMFADRLDSLIRRTIYPAVCAVKDRTALLFEAFEKSNRLALMWAFPFGVSLALFAPDLISFVLGERWREAEVLLQVFGLTIAVRQVAFNWVIFYSAIGDTRPLAVSSFVQLGVFAAVTAPLMIAFGLDGYAAGMAIAVLRRPRRPRPLPRPPVRGLSDLAPPGPLGRPVHPPGARDPRPARGRPTPTGRSASRSGSSASTSRSRWSRRSPSSAALLAELFGYLRRGMRAGAGAGVAAPRDGIVPSTCSRAGACGPRARRARASEISGGAPAVRAARGRGGRRRVVERRPQRRRRPPRRRRPTARGASSSGSAARSKSSSRSPRRWSLRPPVGGRDQRPPDPLGRGLGIDAPLLERRRPARVVGRGGGLELGHRDAVGREPVRPRVRLERRSPRRSSAAARRARRRPGRRRGRPGPRSPAARGAGAGRARTRGPSARPRRSSRRGRR